MSKRRNINMMQTAIKIASAILFALFANATTALAKNSSVGSLVRVVNESHITDQSGVERKVARRSSIYPGDIIRTGEDGWVTINFFDLTRVVLRPNTEFVVRKFPQTMDKGEIELEFIQGGARITTGTIAKKSRNRFKVVTPQGEIKGVRSEWVIRSCVEDECTILETNFPRCASYINPETQNRQFVSAYKDDVNINYCPVETRLEAGTSLVYDVQQQTCQVIEEVPCFILFDSKLGRDKLRKLRPKLTLTEEAKELKERPDRPDARKRPRRP